MEPGWAQTEDATWPFVARPAGHHLQEELLGLSVLPESDSEGRGCWQTGPGQQKPKITSLGLEERELVREVQHHWLDLVGLTIMHSINTGTKPLHRVWTVFFFYMLPPGHVISHYGVSFHCYANDTQLYMKTDKHSSVALPSSSSLFTLTACLEEIKIWMKLLVGTLHHIQSSSITSISVSGQEIPLSSSVTNLGVRFDPNLTFEAYIKHHYKTSCYHHRVLPNFIPYWPYLMLKSLSKPLSPPGWITAMCL